MSSTLGDIVTDVLAALHTSQGDADERTYLTAGISPTDLTLAVGDGDMISPGLVEIGDELLWVLSVDREALTATVAPFGRGYMGTTAATHALNAEVRNSPAFPRSRVKAAIAAVLEQVYPDVFQVKTDVTQTTIPVQVCYPLPSDCDFVLSVSYQVIGPSGLWAPVKRYRLDRQADTGTFASGKTLDVLQGTQPGRKLKVAYVAKPGALVADTDTLASAGLDETARDLLKWGACARLLQEVEAVRVQSGAAEQAERDAFVPTGATTNASRAFYALFQQRLSDEAHRLRQLYPVTAHVGF